MKQLPPHLLPSDDYKTGYGKPPKEHQFQKGQSGNPAGRPKKKRDIRDAFIDALQRKVKIKLDGELKEVAVMDIIVSSFMRNCQKAPPREMIELLRFLQDFVPEALYAHSHPRWASDSVLAVEEDLEESTVCKRESGAEDEAPF